MLPSETMIWQPEFTDKTLSRKTGAVHCSTRPFFSCQSVNACSNACSS
ncbi:PapI protein [Escherichia coli]|nr:PapI protein [Escherichia coli]EES9879116.1 PapI protein [Escherichia coli]EEX4127754.1 PapI protein [Escherichia coli]EEX7409228.1 PapI protein [Escherichia coli]EEZ0562203.1 PapI protein [Escherichia coli]